MKQREIKFRVLVETDDAEAEMIYLGKVECDNGLWFDAPKHIDSYKSVMQYTGLNDAKGKEIYEGDFVNHSISEGHEWAGIHQVVFSDGAFKLKGGNPHGMRYGEIFNFFPHNVEVVGNVFENPELMKK